MSRPLRYAALFAAVLWASPAPAAEQAAPMKFSNQEKRLQHCNAEAKKRQYKERQRQAFISGCLKGEQMAKPATQQERTNACRKEANTKSLKGADREKFMQGCLKR